MTKQEQIKFKVFRVSENTNSFGLFGIWLMDQLGRTWEVGASELNKRKMGEVLVVDCVDKDPHWGLKGFEIPYRKTPDAPPACIQEVWGTKVLQGHVSPETAHMHDHPFGRKRCIQRIWLHVATKGQKKDQTCVCYQTSQKHVYDGGGIPEVMPAGGEDRNANWNKTKKSTYTNSLIVLYLDENEHVNPLLLSVTDEPEVFTAFDAITSGHLTEEQQTTRDLMEKVSRKHYAERWAEYKAA